MRLIEADNIKFTEYINGDIIVSKKKIQNMPTAYDVDKVVKEINNAIIPTAEYRHKFCGSVNPEHCAQYENCEDCVAQKIIEIVKCGYVE